MNLPRVTIALLAGLAAILLVASLGAPSLSGDQLGRLFYAGILVTMVGTWALAEMRGNMGLAARNLLIWGLIVLVITLGYSYRGAFGL